MNEQDCNYLITVAPNKIIRFTFRKLDLEYSANCDYDYIEVYDNTNGRRNKYCQPGEYEDFFSSGRSLMMYFYTDESTRRGGFQIEWKALTPGDVVTRAAITTTTTTTTTTTQTTTTKSTTSDGMTIDEGFDRGNVNLKLHSNFPSGHTK